MKPVAVSVPMVEGAALAIAMPASCNERPSVPAGSAVLVATESAAAANALFIVKPKSLSPTLPSRSIKKSR